ncbi:MAG: helix-turn-helix domain-containing protein [Chitinophagaceae bacterium]|nr:helix-turn-helix domain-containing protein [Microcystis sp. M065S1]MCA6492272.1 helix-turn-helix domain-containing protein [Chitinophagaceae bacterium]
MDKNIVLSPIPLPEILDGLRAIVKEEITSEHSKAVGEKLISPAEACKLFNPIISKVTLTAWTKAGHLRDYRLGGRVFYRQSEIIEAAKHLKKYKKVN